MLLEPLAITLIVVDAFNLLGIDYWIGGSLSSAFHGTARSTLDADLVAGVRTEHIQPLVALLESDFYIDADMIADAIQSNSSFNLIHLKTMFKVDVFILKQRSFEQSQLKRRMLQTVSNDPDRRAFVCTAEDIILAKLEWYRMGGETSDRQWRDILGVITVQDERLDQEYLQHWAVELGVSDLLQKALKQVA